MAFNAYKEIRNEFANKSFQDKLKEKLGVKCIYCGHSGENEIEYHHIVPVSQGGDNRLSNIVPLCNECHKKAHGKNPIEGKKYKKKGRPSNEKPEHAEMIIDLYLENMLGLAEAMEILGVRRHVYYNLVNEYREKYKDSRAHINTGKAKKDTRVFSMLVTIDVEDIESYINRYLNDEMDLADICHYLDVSPEQFKKITVLYKLRNKDNRKNELVHEIDLNTKGKRR